MKLVETFIAYLEGRAKTQLYGIFIFWVLVLHGDIIFTSLFTSQELIFAKTKMLKNEYVAAHFFEIHTWHFWIIEICKFLAAAGLTYLMIWILPKTLVAAAYDSELDTYYKRKMKKLSKDMSLEKEKQRLSDIKLESVEREEEVVEKQDDLENKELRVWKKEYKETKASVKNVLPHLARAVYEHDGHIKRYVDHDLNKWVDPQISSNTIATAHSNGLAELSDNRISLTPKGRYFISQKL